MTDKSPTKTIKVGELEQRGWTPELRRAHLSLRHSHYSRAEADDIRASFWGVTGVNDVYDQIVRPRVDALVGHVVARLERAAGRRIGEAGRRRSALKPAQGVLVVIRGPLAHRDVVGVSGCRTLLRRCPQCTRQSNAAGY
ncbi:hypothetical protein BN11_290008 [Nostocoides australiense Ben110]|uniref:Uncharacterized protein n=1 Tax=Nostocoides australiense Ben110 TaxID=1193182 RepID=W6JXZ9_9MICO|nr:hypothetical protein [Tetrasphaera australiensis]CCH73530.1 hypothetical protein BN11_290008 [Tetrasphaera australiensis Ben110]